MPTAKPIIIPGEVLLVEIDRRCSFAGCDHRVGIGLTKKEAANYLGFECQHCKRWNEDSLTQRDIPDWWDEFHAYHTSH